MLNEPCEVKQEAGVEFKEKSVSVGEQLKVENLV